MPTKQPMTIYRSLFADAARAAWKRKPLWVFGLFAALLSTGGACEMAAKSFHRLSGLQDMYAQMLHGTFTGTQAFGGYVRHMLTLDPGRVTVTLSVLIVLGALAVSASVVSQGALVAGTGPKAMADADAAQVGRHAFWHLLALNLLHKAAHAVFIGLCALPLFLLVSRGDDVAELTALLTAVVAFPVTVAIASVFMLATVHMVREGSHSLDAIHHGIILFRKHWLAAFETGILLFAAVAGAGILFAVAVAVVSVPFAVAISIALLFGNASVFLLVNVAAVATLILLLFTFMGGITTFQYAVWVRFYDHAVAKKRVISKVRRLMGKR